MEFPQAVYHVMNRGAGRREVFLGKEENENFLETLAETHALWGVEVFAYCLFRGRYKGIVVDGDEYLTVVVHYIYLNPVEAGLVREPSQSHF